MSGRLGDILVQQGLISNEQLESVLTDRTGKGLLGDRLLSRGWVTCGQLGEALSEQFEVPYLEVDPQAINLQVVRLLPEKFSRERQVVAIDVSHMRLKLAMVAPDDIESISEAELITGYQVDPVVSLHHGVTAAIDRGFDERTVARQTIVDMKLAELEEQQDVTELAAADPEEEDAPVVKLVQSILLGAINAASSDIHLEPHTPEMRVRYRVDGELQQVMTIPAQIEESVVARIKVMGDMDTTENRRPQDGRLTVQDRTLRVNFRVSTIPTVGGEKVVLRLLDEGTRVFDIDHIGFTPRDRERIQALIDKPHGMFVVTGPTGSGKTTTLYAVLTELNQIKRNIVTIEDPVEFRLPGINQVQSDNEFGMGFANALRFIMRQDPDVIMVGEIRDHETAMIAVQAALTGHLLISTLHTNDSVAAIGRLTDLGVDAFKVAGALLGSVAQRLLRSICPECRHEVAPNPVLLKTMVPPGAMPPDVAFFQGRGCKRCLHTGFVGRIPIFEIMLVTPQIAHAIERGVPKTQIRDLALKQGMVELSAAGLEQVYAGRTSLEEVHYKTSS